MSEPRSSESSSTRTSEHRIATGLGWFVGGGLALLLNYFAFVAVGPGYPAAPTSFVAFVAGAFGGMWVADRLGSKALKTLGISAGILIATAALAAMVLAGR